MYRSVFAWCCLLIISACSTSDVSVSSDFKDEIDYTTLKTYAWYRPGAVARPREIDELMEQRIIASINAELQEKTYTLSDKPDFLVNFSVASKEVYDVNSYYVYPGYTPAFTWNRSGYGMSRPIEETRVNVIREGTLVIDILDASKKAVIWRGVAQQRLPQRSLSKEERDTLVNSAVEQVLAQFPPKK